MTDLERTARNAARAADTAADTALQVAAPKALAWASRPVPRWALGLALLAGAVLGSLGRGL